MASRPPNYDRPCRRKLHTIPAGVMGCPECERERKRESEARRRAKTLRSAGGPRAGRAHAFVRAADLPVAEILAAAACSPTTGDLFEFAAPVAFQRRAKAICAGCPVRAACLEDGIAKRQSGTYGGQYLRAGVVQVVQSVQDSPAC